MKKLILLCASLFSAACNGDLILEVNVSVPTDGGGGAGGDIPLDGGGGFGGEATPGSGGSGGGPADCGEVAIEPGCNGGPLTLPEDLLVSEPTCESGLAVVKTYPGSWCSSTDNPAGWVPWGTECYCGEDHAK